MTYLLQDYVSENAKIQPDSLFIQDGLSTITYGQMDITTNRLARYLKLKGVKRQDCVSLLMPKTINLFKALIATLKADAAYVPLNVQTPLKRNHFILEQSKCKFLCCDPSTQAQAEEIVESIGEDKVTLITITDDTAATESEDVVTYQNSPDDLAYVLYTSGSTGLPKGVMISHGSVMNYAEWTTKYFDIKPSDRISNHPGLFFDLSVFEIYTVFKSGASLHLVPQDISMFPVKVVDFIENNNLTIWNSVPSLYTFMARAKVLNPKRLSGLRALTFNGEVMPTPTVMAWMEACPNARFINQYGPTETTCASLYYEIKTTPTDPSVPIPIGCPLANTQVFALTDDGKEATVSELGELYIMGAGLGKGYLFDQEKTDKAYIRNPLDPDSGKTAYKTGDLVKLRTDGNYDYICRKDHQIKVMGYRIELGEIESTLNAFDYIASSAAVGLAHPHTGDAMVVAFIVMKDNAAGQIDDFRIKSDIGKIIPHYMVPRVIVRMDHLPLNANGKVDRHKLKDHFLSNHTT